MKDKEHLNYLGFNLEYPRDKDIIDYLETIDKGARSYIARQMLRLCIKDLGKSNVVSTVIGADVKTYHNETKNDSNEESHLPKKFKEEVDLKKSEEEGNESHVGDDEGIPAELSNLMSQFGVNS